MTPARAAEVLRDIGNCQYAEEQIAGKMGADALEFQAWLFGDTPDGWLRLGRLYLSQKWHNYPTFEDYCRAEWGGKERKG
jgi:hypothetical protein